MDHGRPRRAQQLRGVTALRRRPRFGGANEWLPLGFERNLSDGFDLLTESSGSALGEIQSCEAATLGVGIASGSFLACEIEFAASADLAEDGEDIFVGLFATGVDALFASDGSDLAAAAVFANASVHPVPEPSAELSIVAVVAALAWRRRSAVRVP